MDSRTKETLKTYTNNGVMVGAGAGFSLGLSAGVGIDIFSEINPLSYILAQRISPDFIRPIARNSRYPLLQYAKCGVVGMVPGAAVGGAAGVAAGLVKVGVVSGLYYFRAKQKTEDTEDKLQVTSLEIKNKKL